MISWQEKTFTTPLLYHLGKSLPVAESFEPYHSIRERKYPYYRIYVDNYVIYYVVISDNPDDLIMEEEDFYIMDKIGINWCKKVS